MAAEIRTALDRALSAEFREHCRGVQNIYGDGHAAGRIVQVLRTTEFNERLLIKSFHYLPESAFSVGRP